MASRSTSYLPSLLLCHWHAMRSTSGAACTSESLTSSRVRSNTPLHRCVGDCTSPETCINGGCVESCSGCAADCTTVVADEAQSVLRYHTEWHTCFGSQGCSSSPEPEQRGQQWLAFHRQMEMDFNYWREQKTPAQDPAGSAAGFNSGKIEKVVWCENVELAHGMPCPFGETDYGVTVSAGQLLCPAPVNLVGVLRHVSATLSTPRYCFQQTCCAPRILTRFVLACIVPLCC